MQGNRDTRGIDPVVGAALVAAYVFGSSFLGLTGPVWFTETPGESMDAWDFFISVWSESLFADAVFVVGTAAAAALAFRLARSGAALGSVGAGFGLNALVYVLSYFPLERSSFTDGVGAVPLILGWGVFGLVFAAFAPAVAARVLEDASGAGATPPAA